MVNTARQGISDARHFFLMLSVSFLSVLLFAGGLGVPLVLQPMLLLIVFVGIGFAHGVSPLLLALYYPLTLKYWQKGQRGFLLFCGTGLWIAGVNGLGLGVLFQGGQVVLGTDDFDLDQVFLLTAVYIICGLMTGALHWMFLTRTQRKLEKQIADDLS